MAGFLYYLPGPVEGVTIKDVRKAGLGYAFDSQNCTAAGVHANGLDEGRQGTIIADPNRVESIGLYPDKQTWRKIPGREVWAGFYTDDRPTPADLARKEQLNGHLVTLLDGNKWLCSVARGAAEEDGSLVWFHALPQRLVLTDMGEVEHGDVIPRYAGIFELATRWFDLRMDALRESDGQTIETKLTGLTGLAEAASEAMGINYVVGLPECIDLLTEPLAVEILDALIDMPTRYELLKKITDRLDGSPSDDGPSAATPDTDQP